MGREISGAMFRATVIVPTEENWRAIILVPSINAYSGEIVLAQRMASRREPKWRVGKKQEPSTATVKAICIPTMVSGVPNRIVTCLFTSIIPPEQNMKAATDRPNFMA